MNGAGKRILLSGYYGYNNLGDEALLEVIAQQIHTRLPGAMLDVLTATPQETAQAYGVETTLRTDLRAIKAAIIKADIVLSGGGGLLQNTTSLKSLLYYTGILTTAARYKKPAMIFAQSIGPLDALGRRVVGRLCRGVQLATVRDTRSAEFLKRLLPDLDVELTGDPVFLYEPGEPDATVLRGLEGEAGPLAVVSIRPSAQSDHVTRLVAQMVDHLAITRGIQSVFLSLGGMRDAEVATAVIRRCRSKPILLPTTDLATVGALIARSQIVVGMRLHALILAARYATPFLAFAYDPKVSALLEDLAYPLPPAWSSDPKERLGDPMLLLDRVMDEHADIAESLRVSGLRMRKAAERNFSLLEDLLQSEGRRRMTSDGNTNDR